jgi:hypothetical protein
MKDSKYWKAVVWFVFATFAYSWAFELITMASTVANIVGIVVVAFVTWITLKTKCFTTLTFKKHKDEKSN